MPKTIADPNAVTISLTLSSRSATFLCSVFMPVFVSVLLMQRDAMTKATV